MINKINIFSNIKAQSLPKKLIFSFLLLFLIGMGVWFVHAMTIQVISPINNSANNVFITNSSSVNLSYGITLNAGETLNNITHSWNGTNTTLIDYQMLGMCNMNNLSALNENDTLISCWSPNGDINGSIFGGTNVTFNSGKYGLAFNGINGSKGYVNVSSNINNGLNRTTQISILFWGKRNKLGVTSTILSWGYAEPILLRFEDSDKIMLQMELGLIATPELEYGSTPLNTWNRYAITYNNATDGIQMYINGVNTYNGTAYKGKGVINFSKYMTNTLIIGTTKYNSVNLNGSLDDVMVLNRSLSQLELTQDYISSYTKYNSTYYQYNTTQNTSILSSSSFLCSSNVTNVFCSATNNIRELATLKSNFSNSKWILNNPNYGIYGSSWFSTDSFAIDTNNDSILDTSSNYSWNRQALLNSGIKYVKKDMNLYYYYNNYSNGIANYTTTFLNERDQYTDIIKWGHDNGIKIVLDGGKIPQFLANKTSGYCLLNKSTNDTCSPTNYSLYGDIVVDFITNVTDNGLYNNTVEFNCWVEPNSGSFLNNLSIGNPIKTDEIIKICNASFFAIKTKYPNMPVGGPSTVRSVGGYDIMLYPFIGNLSNIMDFVSFDSYGQYLYVNVFSDYNYLKNNISAMGLTIPRIVITEMGFQWDGVITNPTSSFNPQWGLGYAGSYIDLLNLEQNITFLAYQWQDRYYYGPYLPEFPDFHSFVKEPLMGGPIYYPPYNVTSSFAHLCPSGGSVYVSSSDDDIIKVVSCQKGASYSTIIINTDTNAKNVTLNLSMVNGSVKYPYNNFTNYTGTNIFPITNGIIQLGIMNSYDIAYLSSGVPPTITQIQPANLTINTTSQVNFSANLTDDVGLTNSTLNILNTSDNSIKTFFTNYVSGEVSVIQSFLVWLSDGIYKVWWSLFDDEGKETLSGNYTETIAIPPTFTTIPNNQSIQFGNESLLVVFTGTDETSFDTYSVNDSRFSINDTGFLINITNTPVGNYSMNITINDTSNNINWTIFTLQVRDTILPTLVFEPQTTNSSNFSQSNIYLNVTTSDYSNYSILSNVELRAWYRMNNESGENNTYIKDYSGYGNNLTGYNGTKSNSTGRLGYSMKFNGVDDVMIASSETGSTNISDEITIWAWFKLDSFGAYKRIIAKSPSTGVYPYTTYGLLTDTNTSGVARLRMELSSGGIQHIIKSSSGINLNQDIFLVGTWNGSDNSAKIYINGVLDNSTLFRSFSNGTLVEASNILNGKIDTNNVPIAIGCASYGSTTCVNALIDDAGIVHRAWSLNEVQAYYNATRLDHNITNLADGNYNLTVYAQDSSGNVNSTSRWVSLDTTKSIINILFPTNMTYDHNVSNITYTMSDANPNYCWYSEDDGSTNSSLIVPNTTFTMILNTVNFNTWKVWCNDSANNLNSSSTSFSLNIPPSGGAIDTGGGGTTGGGNGTWDSGSSITLDHLNITWDDFYFNAGSYIYVLPLDKDNKLVNITNLSINIMSSVSYKKGAMQKLIDGRQRQSFNIAKTDNITEFVVNVFVTQGMKQVEQNVVIPISSEKAPGIENTFNDYWAWFESHWFFVLVFIVIIFIIFAVIFSGKGGK